MAAENGEEIEEGGIDPVFKNLDEFVRLRYLPVYVRSADSVRWCSQWWRHAEAVSRFQALWHSWELLRWEPGSGMAIWYREHLDPQMNVIHSKDGPFASCTPDEHVDVPALPVAVPPEGWFEDEW